MDDNEDFTQTFRSPEFGYAELRFERDALTVNTGNSEYYAAVGSAWKLDFTGDVVLTDKYLRRHAELTAEGVGPEKQGNKYVFTSTGDGTVQIVIGGYVCKTEQNKKEEWIMKKARKISACILTAALLLTMPISAAKAQPDGGNFQFRRLVVDDRDADGNLRKPYWVDANGNEITVPKPEREVSAQADTLPASYDLRDFGYVTPVKNQAQVGACWAFGTIACMESSMLRQGYGTAADTDYSEAHLAWFSQRQRTPDTSDPTYGDGYDVANPFDVESNYFFTSSALMRGSGVQLEKNAPWTEPQSAEDAMRDMAQQESDRYVSFGRLYTSRWLYDCTVNDIKQALLQNGNVSLAYFHYPDGRDAANACQYQNVTNMYVNHGVEIVGWDDNFSKDNFNEAMRPRGDGAFLVKGSWGTDFGDGGYYWLSYRDPSIDSVFTMVAKPKDIYDNIYQYDGAIPLGTFSAGRFVRAANRFRSTKQETLTHVAFWSENYWGVSAHVEVYVADEDYVPDDSNPIANMKLIDAATTVLDPVTCGYYTVELKTPVNVSGRYYTVVLQFTNPYSFGSSYLIPPATMSLEGSGSVVLTLDCEMSYSGKAGQSFMYGYPGEAAREWTDCTTFGKYYNVPIKAMTCDKAPASGGFSLTYNANGGSGAPAVQKGVGAVTISEVQPVRAGFTFLGWADSASAKEAQYAPGAPFTLTENVMLYAVWQTDPNAPTVTIRNFVPERTERYFTTVSFTADAKNMPADAQTVWYIDGKQTLVGADKYAYAGAKKDYTVQVKLQRGDTVLTQSAVETVHIRHGFTDVLRSLFRVLFGRPYYVEQ